MASNKFSRITLAAIGLATALCLSFPLNASAMDFAGYFSFSYNSSLSQTTVNPGGVLSLVLTGIATCQEDLPFTISGAVVSGRVVAVGANSNTFVLNPGYAVSIGAFQTKKGQSVQNTQIVGLSFPGDMAPGQYDIVGQVIEAKVQVVLWFSVTSYVPSSMSMGTVTLLAPPPPVPVPVPTPTAEPSPTPTPTPTAEPSSAPASTSTTAPTVEPSPPDTTTPTATTPAITPKTSTSAPTPVPTAPTTGEASPTIFTGPKPTSEQPPVPIASMPVTSVQPTGTVSVTPPASSSVSVSPMAGTSEGPKSGITSLPEASGLVPWIVFPLSVGAFTLLLVILAVARSPRRPVKKDNYILNLPEL